MMRTTAKSDRPNKFSPCVEKNGLVLFQLNLTLRFNNVNDEVHKCKTKIQVLRKEMVRDRVYCDDSYYELTRMQFMDYNVNSF